MIFIRLGCWGIIVKTSFDEIMDDEDLGRGPVASNSVRKKFLCASSYRSNSHV